MVQIVPPAGWQPAQAASAPIASGATHAGPPPLNRVAVETQLELEPSQPFSVTAVLGQTWAMWTVGLTTAIALAAVVWLLLAPSAPQSVDDSAVNASQTASTTANANAEERSKPAGQTPLVVDKEAEAAKTAMPGPVTKDSDTASKPPIAPVKTEEPAARQTPAQPTADNNKSSDVALFGDLPGELADSDGPSPADIRKTPRPMIDVPARFEERLPQLELTDVPLARAVEILAELSTVPITIDVDLLVERGISPRRTVTVKLQSTTIGKALEEVVGQLGLAAAVDHSQAMITAPPEYRENLRQVKYSVNDLTGDGQKNVAAMIPIVRGLVAPESWQENGGRGKVEASDSALVVMQTGDVHQQILVFCEKLRNARHKPLRSRDDPERFALATRLEQAQKVLDQRLSVNFHQPTPLAKVVAALQQRANVGIVVDHAALAAIETSDRVEATLTVKDVTLAAALKKLLRPLGMAYRVIGRDVIQITSKEAADERLELEFYPIKAWLDAGFTGPKLAERLKARVAGRTWSDVGGAGEIYFDEPSGCLIVLQSQPTQAAVARLLGSPVPKKG